jgi:hypothetical protein
MKKTIGWTVFLLVLGIIGFFGYQLYKSKGASISAYSLIPDNAVYVLETTEPIKTWKNISSSAMWKHLQKNTYFAEITASANSLDSLVRDNDELFSLLGSRTLLVSAHSTGFKRYDFIFLIDFGKASGIKFLENYLDTYSAKGLTFSRIKIEETDVLKMYDNIKKTTLYIALEETYMVASYDMGLMKASLSSLKGTSLADSPTFVRSMEGVEGNGDLRIFLNYPVLDEHLLCYMDGRNEYISYLSRALTTSALYLKQDDELITIKGYTYLNDSMDSYMKALAMSGKGGNDIASIAPERTAFYLGMSFNSFQEFFDNVEANIKKDVKDYQEYQQNMETVEKYLKINLKENFLSWIGDEVAILQLKSGGTGNDNEVALVLKAANIETARKQLDYVEKMIRRRSPVKFKEVTYKDYRISYLSVKGLFKVLLGKFFARYDKPYYTIINDKVIFSNHPQVLESMIDDYLEGTTLVKQDHYKNFRKNFKDESSIFVYLNTSVLFTSLKNLANPETKIRMEANKSFITCFSDIGFQLSPDNGRFETIIAEQFIDPHLPDSATNIDSEKKQPDVSAPDHSSIDDNTANKAPVDLFQLPYIYAKNPNNEVYREYYSDSMLMYEVELKYGFKDGDFKEYHPNGEVKLKGKFKKDKRVGTWKAYSEEGKLLEKKDFD